MHSEYEGTKKPSIAGGQKKDVSFEKAVMRIKEQYVRGEYMCYNRVNHCSNLHIGGTHMALKNMLMSLTGKKQDVSERKMDAVNALIANEQFPVIREADMNMSLYKQVPLMGLAALGAAFMQLPEASRTLTTTVTQNIGLRETLFVGVNPKSVAGFLRDNGQGVSGNIFNVNEQGKQVIAGRLRFSPLNQLPITETTSTVMPFDPMTMVIAAAVFSIDQKLIALQQKTEEILQFLKVEKQSRQRGNLNMLTEIMEEYKRDCGNEKMCSLRVVEVQAIKREALQDIEFYQKQIDIHLQEQKTLHGTKQVQTLLENLMSEFCEYQIACYLYGFASFMEVMLQKEFETTHLNAANKAMSKYAARYSELYKDCRAQIAEYQRSAIEAQLLGGIGGVVKAAGEKLAAVPVLNKGPVDEALIHAGKSLGKYNRDAVAKRLEQFEPLEDSHLSAFVESMNTLDVVYNHREGLLTDGEHLYIRTVA